MFADLEKILLRPKEFFTERKNCGWREPFLFFIIPTIIFLLYSIRSLIETTVFVLDFPIGFWDMCSFYFMPFLLFFREIFFHSSIVLVLGSFITLLLYAFHYKVNFLEIFKVLLFTQVLFIFFLFIFSVIRNTIPTELFFMHFDVLLVLWYLYLIIGLSWIIHTIITGVTIFIDIPYKKGIIPVGVPLVIFSYFFWPYYSLSYKIFVLLITKPIFDLLL